MLNAKWACYGCGDLVCDKGEKYCAGCDPWRIVVAPFASSEYASKPDHTTVYPSRAGGFPPASFRTFADALTYTREISDSRPPCGICMCPAGSYEMHQVDCPPLDVCK